MIALYKSLYYHREMVTWFSLTVLSVFFLIGFFFLSKKIFNDEADVDPRFYGASLQLATGIVGLPIALYVGFHFELTYISIALLVLMATSYVIGPSLYYMGLKYVDLSEAMVLGSSSVIWSLILGVLLLGESLALIKVVGILFIFLAIVLVSYKPNLSLKSYSKYKIFLLTAPIFYVFGATFDNRLVNYSNAATYMSISFLLGGGFMFLANIHRFKNKGLNTYKNKQFWYVLPINAVFVYLAYVCIIRAYELGGEVSRILPIQQSESILVPIIGILFLKERSKVAVKIIAAIIAFIGILFIKY